MVDWQVVAELTIAPVVHFTQMPVVTAPVVVLIPQAPHPVSEVETALLTAHALQVPVLLGAAIYPRDGLHAVQTAATFDPVGAVHVRQPAIPT